MFPEQSIEMMVADMNGDGLPDGYETQYNLDPYHNNASQDLDNDGLTNYEEYSYNMPDDYNLTKDGPYTGGLNPLNSLAWA